MFMMEREVHVICLVLILTFGLLLPVILGENCPVNPDCTCWEPYIYCNPKCGPSVPKFAASSKNFTEVGITGIRDIRLIAPGTFQSLSTTKLFIQDTGISEISCEAFKGIVRGLESLHLRYNYLESVPSCSLQHVKGITELRLTENHISNLTRDSFINVPDLQTLYLDQNEIETIEMGSFNNLSKVIYLNLSINKLSNLSATVFDGLKSLENLTITRNRITSIHSKSFDGLESLTLLDLSENEIGDLDETTFERLTNIEGLSLAFNRISSLPEGIFAKLETLFCLYLQGNYLVSLPDNVFQPTPLLRTLHMQINDFPAISERLFTYTPNLQILDVSGNRLTTVTNDVFKECNQLRELSMRYNNIEDLETGCFRNLSSLSVLDLSGNFIKKIQNSVFENLTNLTSLSLAANRISFIENGSLRSQQESLIGLNLGLNKLTSGSWVTLTPILTTLDKLVNLDLSQNPIGDLPAPVIESLRNITDLNLRNCNLTYFPFNTTRYRRRDISVNNLKNNFDILMLDSNPSLSESSDNRQAVSCMTFSTGYASLSRPDSYSVKAQQNEIKNVDIIWHPTVTKIDSIQLSKNLISTSLVLKTAEFDLNEIEVESLDLSYNTFNNVTSHPIIFHPMESDYSYIIIGRLNLSHNNISFVSPEASLGRIGYLDLSHNRIQVLGRLLPANASHSDFITYYIDLSYNFIHRITSDVFSDYEKIIKNINLAVNSLIEIQSLRNVLEEESFERLFLSDNPLNCDCESFWLRQDSVASKLVSARCAAPDSANSYMSFCYPLENCSPRQNLNMSASVVELCKNDTLIIIDNLEIITLGTVGNSFIVNVTWNSRGGGQITGYKLEITPRENSTNGMASLVHSAALDYIIYGLEFKMAYNVCISTVKEQVTVGEVLCTSLQVDATDDSIAISKLTLIGISAALGLSVLCIFLLLLGYIICHQKLRCCHKKYSTANPPSSSEIKRTRSQDNLDDNNLYRTDTTINRSDSCNTQNSDPSLTDQTNNSHQSEMYLHPVTGTYAHPMNRAGDVDDSNIYETVREAACKTEQVL